MALPHSLYVLILAGGSGERFWPLSRKTRPKQLLTLFSDQSLLEATIGRLAGLVAPEHIFILTNHEQEASVRALARQVPAENIIAEPAKRDTAPAIALGAGLISARDRTATMIVLPADQLIRDEAGFQRTLRTACGAAQQTGELVTIGIRPTWACPGFGYIELGKTIDVTGNADAPEVREVLSFREKPNAELAESFLKQGHFRWNAGMFVWTVASIVSAFQRHAPALGDFIAQIHQSPNWPEIVGTKFAGLPKISIDYAVMEKAERVLMVESAFDWDDIGGWAAMAKYLETDAAGNAANTALTAIDASDNIVYSDPKTHVALMGVKDLIVVRTGDALLICRRADAEKIKNLVAKVPSELQ